MNKRNQPMGLTAPETGIEPKDGSHGASLARKAGTNIGEEPLETAGRICVGKETDRVAVFGGAT